MRQRDPALTLIYLPHLDYVLQRDGPDAPTLPAELREVDRVIGALLDACAQRGARPIVVSEYGIEAATRPVHANRALREAGLLRVRDELGRDMLEPMASPAFALCDHQIAHVYVRDANRIAEAARVLAALPGVERVLDRAGQAELNLDHPRSGDLVLMAEPGAWFAYPWWLDDARAPDFARGVDIHRKPGFDPCELLIDPAVALPALRVAKFKLARALGFRSTLRLTPLDASLVKGTHGRTRLASGFEPVLLAENSLLPESDLVSSRDVCGVLLRHLFERNP
jgi:hypothetical protein